MDSYSACCTAQLVIKCREKSLKEPILVAGRGRFPFASQCLNCCLVLRSHFLKAWLVLVLAVGFQEVRLLKKTPNLKPTTLSLECSPWLCWGRTELSSAGPFPCPLETVGEKTSAKPSLGPGSSPPAASGEGAGSCAGWKEQIYG